MNLNGYRPTHRNKWLLIAEQILSIEELLLFDYYIDQMDFDKRHKNYGHFSIKFQDIAKFFCYKSENSIRNKHKKLVRLGFIYATEEKGLYAIHNPDRYVAQTKKWQGKANDYQTEEDNQSFDKIVQNIAGNIQLNATKLQTIEKKRPNLIKNSNPRSLISSKIQSNVLSDNVESSYTKEAWELERIKDPGLPSWENKLLIDESIRETVLINDEKWYNKLE